MFKSGSTFKDCRRYAVGSLIATGLCLAHGPLAGADQWVPQRTVEWIVPAAAGGGFDQTVRMLHSIVSRQSSLPVPLIVINKPGAGGVVAWGYMIQKRGGGHHISVSAPNLLTNEIEGKGSIGLDSITPIVNLYEEFSVVTVRADSLISTGRDLVSRLIKDPGSVTIAVAPSLGSGNHLAVVIALRSAGVDVRKLRVVPYASSGASATALLGGEVDVMSASTAVAAPWVSAGRIRVLAASSASRLDGVFASAPTWKEQGVESEFPSWLSVIGPRDFSSQVAYWESIFAQAIHAPEWKEYLAKTYRTEKFMRSAETMNYLQQKRRVIVDIMTELGLAKNPRPAGL